MIIYKFNILEFERGVSEEAKSHFKKTFVKGTKWAKNVGKYVGKWTFCLVYKNGKEMSQIAAPIYFHTAQ